MQHLILKSSNLPKQKLILQDFLFLELILLNHYQNIFSQSKNSHDLILLEILELGLTW